MKNKYDHAVESWSDLVLIHSALRVTWEYLGEGLDGDYDPDDVLDFPHLRFTVDQRTWSSGQVDDGEWQELPNASYCTRMPINAPEWMLIRALGEILEAARQPSPKRRLEELSWLRPEDFDDKDPDERNSGVTS